MRHANSCCSRPVVHIFGNPLLRQPFHETMSVRHFASVVVPATPAITNHHGKTTDSKVSVTSSNSTTGDSSSSNDIGGGTSGNRRRIVERKAPLTIVRRADYLYFALVTFITLALNPYFFFCFLLFLFSFLFGPDGTCCGTHTDVAQRKGREDWGKSRCQAERLQRSFVYTELL